MIHKSLPVALCLMLLGGGASAQETAQQTLGHAMHGTDQACTTANQPLPPALSGWANKSTLGSAAQASALKAAVLPLDQGILVALHPTRQVRYVTQPEKPGGSVAHGGMVTVPIVAAGRYQVSLSSSAWIDLLENGAPQPSVAHAPGPKCTPIRKTVVFSLRPGSYVLQLSANAGPSVTVMVTRVS